MKNPIGFHGREVLCVLEGFAWISCCSVGTQKVPKGPSCPPGWGEVRAGTSGQVPVLVLGGSTERFWMCPVGTRRRNSVPLNPGQG